MQQMLMVIRKSSSAKSNIVAFVVTLAAVHVVLLATGYSYLKLRHTKSLRLAIPNSFQSKYSTENDDSIEEVGTVLQNSSSTKTILLWNIPSSVSYPTELDRERCGDCIISTKNIQMNESDAIVFNFRGMTRPEQFPQRSVKNRDQVYVWLCRESPRTTRDNYKLDLTRLDNIFNWTMTYRLDSDVFFPYSEMLHRNHDEKWSNLRKTRLPGPAPVYVDMYYSSVDELLARKRNMVAWVVGNCDATEGAKARMKLVNSLMKAGLSVHRFGKCFKGKEFPPYRSEDAHEKLIEFKFYLAFENTFGCRDYVTYKFWKNAIYSGTVPIVWGTKKADLLRLAPKNSFIHIEDFASMNHLIYYLKYLDSNDTAYMEYFSWREREKASAHLQLSSVTPDNEKTDWVFSIDEAFGYCKLCRMLQGIGRPDKKEKFRSKTIASLNDWWYGTEDRNCLT